MTKAKTTRCYVTATRKGHEQISEVLVSDLATFGEQIAVLIEGGCSITIEPISKTARTNRNGDPFVWITEHDMADVFCWLLD